MFIHANLHIFECFQFYAKGTAVSQPELHHNVNKAGSSTTNYPPTNQATMNDDDAPISRNGSIGSRHESPPVSPHGPHVKPRMVCIALLLLYIL